MAPGHPLDARSPGPEDFEGWLWVKTAQEEIALIQTGEVTIEVTIEGRDPKLHARACPSIRAVHVDLGDREVGGRGSRPPRRQACREACQWRRIG